MVSGRIPFGRPNNVVVPPVFVLTSEDDNGNDVDVVRTTPVAPVAPALPIVTAVAPVLPVGSLPVLLFELALDPDPFGREGL
jgi:hypothetical protein